MLTYRIEDPISPDLSGAVEVTVDVGGPKRWCFFATPRLLERVGDFVPGTRVRVHPACRT